MAGMEWILEAILVLLLGATLYQAARLERALGVLKRDRTALEAMVAEFNDSTQQAEAGMERLRNSADGAGRQLARQVDAASRLREDLVYLADRGDGLADRLDKLVRAGRPLAAEPLAPALAVTADRVDAPRPRSQAEQDLLKALRMAR